MIGLGLSVHKIQGIPIGGGGGGPTPPSGDTPPLDAYPATAAYSVRLLRTAYSGSALRVRRNAAPFDEQDIGFTAGGDLDEAAIVAFGGSDVLVVSVWYDQSGLSNDASQATAGNQPQIYNGTAVITDNGKPALDVNNHSLETTTDISLPTDLTMFYVTRKDDTTAEGSILGYGNSIYAEGFAGRGLPQFCNDVGSTFLISNTIGNNFSMTLAAQQKLIFSNRRGTTGASGLNGVTELTATASQTTGVTFNRIIGTAGGYHSYDGLVQEAIFYASDESSNRTAIESDINSYFQITNLPDYTSGLLADYSGAAAAYSVRQLSNTAIKCMRVRRAVAPFDEQDIGFTAGGDLDEAAIVAFGGSDELRVSAWYDQSGQSNHAKQSTSSTQPQIYNGTAVIAENGKPALQFAQDGFTAITGSRSDVLFHQAAGGLAMCVLNPTANTQRLCIIAETNGAGSGAKGFVFGWDDRVSQGDNDSGYYALTAGTGATGAFIASNEASFVTGSQSLMAIEYDWDAGIYQYQDGSLLDSYTGTSTPATGDATYNLNIGSIGGNNAYGLAGTMQELILWNAHDTNRTGIETNINSYFQIYP